MRPISLDTHAARAAIADDENYIFRVDNLSLDLHLQSINEMLRVSKEVLVFPLLDVNAVRSPYVNVIINKYRNMNYYVEEVKVNYEFQKGGNNMLKIISKK